MEVPCVREKEIQEVFREVHDDKEHFSWKKMMKLMREKVWWKTMSRDTRIYVDGCLTCAKYGPAIQSHELHPFLLYQPFNIVGIDFIEPLEECAGNRYILHIINYFTRYTRSWATKGDTPMEAAKCFEEYCVSFQPLMAVYHDVGTHFTSPLFRQICKDNNVADMVLPSGASKSTGMIERANRVLEDCLKKACNGNLSLWSFKLPYATQAVNIRVVLSTGFTPFELLFGLPHWLPFQRAISGKYMGSALTLLAEQLGKDAWDEAWMGKWADIHQVKHENNRKEAWSITCKNAKEMKGRYDREITGKEYHQGDVVMLWNTTIGKGIGKKLEQSWRGPFWVQDRVGNVTYCIAYFHGPTVPGTFHRDHLKLFQKRTGYIAGKEEDDELVVGPRDIRRLRRRNNRGRRVAEKIVKTHSIAIIGDFWGMVEDEGVK
ncbi:MAG: uncharacterized protein JWR35_3880 [Marmoricola sp.]|nr:uncharacterized protein [Marmoricola sp.]